MRRRIQLAHGILCSWWSSVPRCTSKSGWIRVDAAPTLARRTILQIASAKMAIAAMQRVGPA